MTRQLKIRIVIGVVVVGSVLASFFPPIRQDPEYHQFVDDRRLLGIPNFWNVMTNVPFVLVGLLGLGKCVSFIRSSRIPELGPSSIVFFIGVTFVGVGSAIYHYAPSTTTLLWDRLPMTVAFMALLALVVGDSISPKYGKNLLWPLTTIGVGSVVYWFVTEQAGTGDLRLYGLVQFLPMIVIPLILYLFGSQSLRPHYVWATFGTYLTAKIAEHFDAALYQLTAVISGHSAKHLLAALATFWILCAIKDTTDSKGRTI